MRTGSLHLSTPPQRFSRSHCAKILQIRLDPFESLFQKGAKSCSKLKFVNRLCKLHCSLRSRNSHDRLQSGASVCVRRETRQNCEQNHMHSRRLAACAMAALPFACAASPALQPTRGAHRGGLRTLSWSPLSNACLWLCCNRWRMLGLRCSGQSRTLSLSFWAWFLRFGLVC